MGNLRMVRTLALLRGAASQALVVLVPILLCNGCRDRNYVTIYNKSSKPITISYVKVAGFKKSTISQTIAPGLEKHMNTSTAYGAYAFNDGRILEVEALFGGTAASASCLLKAEPGGCFFDAVFHGPGRMKCVCQPNSDFH